MYIELRKLKELGKRGKLDEENRYLMWLPRAAIVASVAALDAYVHQALYLRLPELLGDKTASISDELADLIGRVMPTKKKVEVKEAMRFIRSHAGPRMLADLLRENVLRYESYQDPAKVIKAFKLISIQDIFAKVAHRWQSQTKSRADITKELSNYVRRRNQIAHESDLDSNHEPRAITPDYGEKCLKFIRDLVGWMDTVVFPNKGNAQQ